MVVGSIMIKKLKSDKQKEAIALIRDSFLNKLTTEQINAYIDNQVVDLASAKAYLKKISKVMLYILRHSNLQ